MFTRPVESLNRARGNIIHWLIYWLADILDGVNTYAREGLEHKKNKYTFFHSGGDYKKEIKIV